MTQKPLALPLAASVAAALSLAGGHAHAQAATMETRALETTMREDAAAGRPLLAACVVSRVRDGLPGRGFFDLACALSRGPRAGESDHDFHARERAALTRLAA